MPVSQAKTVRSVLDACTDCDICRFLMDESCLLFPELYRLYDKEKEEGHPVSEDELQRLSELCTLCGLCPCPNIRGDVIQAKTERVSAKGLPLHIRLLADVQRIGRWGSLAPKALNKAFSFSPVSRFTKKVARIHPRRNLPRLPEENFFVWARKKGLDREAHQSPKVAYFVGCTAGYLFPVVAQATVAVLQHNGISVHVPPQQCCGMPTMLEGDERTTFERVRFNVQALLKALQNGYKLVCSCPTCGFLMKVLLNEGACYSKAYQRSVNADEYEIKVPGKKTKKNGFIRLKKSMYEKILKDDAYFSSLNPLERISLSENILDMGEYLNRLHRNKLLRSYSDKLNTHMVYYAPCHQREQGIGSPYLDMLNLIPGLKIEQVGGAMDCCGMGGSLGFKEAFYDKSMELSAPLIKKIKNADPHAVITECLSCRLQFQHQLPYPVYHPIEILLRAYESNKTREKEY